jgi:hypothetical protein
MIEPKFPFRQFFDFRFGVNASRFFNLPHPHPLWTKSFDGLLAEHLLAAFYRASCSSHYSLIG